MTGSTAEPGVMDPTALDELAELIFGDGAYELVRKMNPTQADLAAKKKREKRQAQVGLASNIIGLGAGIAGTAEAHQKFKTVRAERGSKGFKIKGGKLSAAMPGAFKDAASTAGKVAGKIKTKHVVGLAGAGLGLQVANVAGDAVANRVLARSAKDEPKKKVAKKDELGAPTISRGKLVAVAAQTAQPSVVKATKKVKDQINKSDIVWEGEFSKFDMDKRQVFGWASVVEINGEPVIDRQGDYIEAEEIEKAAYNYVVKSRKGGDMHRRENHELGERPFHASDMIESFMVTPEKLEKMGLPPGSLPTGWWVGYQVNDEATWDLVKKGQRTGFSIHGKGKRKDL